jgi:tripartite ATP-independent transporter DctM subunit
MSTLVMIVLLIVFMMVRVPVALSLALASGLYLATHGIPLSALVQNLSTGVNSFALLAAPFYLLVGALMNTGGVTDRIFFFVSSIVGHIRGALGHANVLGSMIFAGIQGAAVADAAGLGAIEIKAMEKNGYDKDFSVAITASSATIGPIIPPSIIMVIIGVSSQTSIGKLFLGGIVPGIIMGAALMILVAITAARRNYPKGVRPTIALIARTFWQSLPALFTPVIIVGGILGGVFTPTEAGAVTVLYAFVLSVFVFKEIKLAEVPKILLETMLTTGRILFIVGASMAFGWILAYDQTPQKLTQIVVGAISDPTLFIVICMVGFLFLGCIMEAASIVVMTLPVLIPTIAALHIDPVHFGVLTAIAMAIGTLTPPLGIVMFVLMQVSGLSFQRYVKAILPHLAVLIAVLFFLVFFPQLVLWIPNAVIK